MVAAVLRTVLASSVNRPHIIRVLYVFLKLSMHVRPGRTPAERLY